MALSLRRLLDADEGLSVCILRSGEDGMGVYRNLLGNLQIHKRKKERHQHKYNFSIQKTAKEHEGRRQERKRETKSKESENSLVTAAVNFPLSVITLQGNRTDCQHTQNTDEC